MSGTDAIVRYLLAVRGKVKLKAGAGPPVDRRQPRAINAVPGDYDYNYEIGKDSSRLGKLDSRWASCHLAACNGFWGSHHLVCFCFSLGVAPRTTLPGRRLANR